MDTRQLSDDPWADDESKKQLSPDIPPFETSHSVIIIFADNPNILQFTLGKNGALVLGRRRDDGVQQTDIDLAPYGGFVAGVSRRHARMVREDDVVLIEDLGSTNGTYLGNERLRPGALTALRQGAPVRFAQLQGWVYYAQSSS